MAENMTGPGVITRRIVETIEGKDGEKRHSVYILWQ